MGQRPDELRHGGGAASHTDADDEFDESTATEREDIEFTRAEMTSTIDAIQDRLDPEVLSDQAKDTAHDVTDHAIREAKEAAREITDHAIEQAREAIQDITGQAKAALRDATIGKVEDMARTASDTAGGWRQSVFETIKANPMPAALMGVGLGWMLLNRPSGGATTPGSASTYGYAMQRYPRGAYNTPGYGAPSFGSESDSGGVGGAASAAQETIGRVVDQTQQTAGEAMQQVQSTAGQVVDQAQEAGGQVVEQVQQQASRAQGFLERQLQENPLLVGAVALAVGGVLAGTVPSTSREDHMLGATRDRVMGSAKELSQDAMQKVGRVVDEAQSAAAREAKQQSLIPESSGI